jgi:excinuclease UvrABC helicase subunit UvrB
MKLDNEQQRELLLTIIRNTPLQGSYQQIKEVTVQIDNLVKDIQEAEI